MDNMTAKVSCFARAYHYKNNSTRIFADNIAKELLGDDYNQKAFGSLLGISYYLKRECICCEKIRQQQGN